MSDLLPYVEPAPKALLVPWTDAEPLLRTLNYVVEEAAKHKAAGYDDHFVEVGRVAQIALLWRQADERQNIDEAEKWLARLPRST